MLWTLLIGIGAVFLILFVIRQVAAWNEAKLLIDGVEERNQEFTLNLIRQFKAVYVHEFETAHRDTPKGT